MEKIVKELSAIVERMDQLSDTIRYETKVLLLERADAERLGLTGDDRVKHYNEFMEKYSLPYLKIIRRGTVQLDLFGNE